MEKVFCGKCKYLYSRVSWRHCDYPDNITIKRDWECEWKSNIREPKQINKKNNCKWFVEKINAKNL